jgi:hypothetical protein
MPQPVSSAGSERVGNLHGTAQTQYIGRLVTAAYAIETAQGSGRDNLFKGIHFRESPLHSAITTMSIMAPDDSEMRSYNPELALLFGVLEMLLHRNGDL